MRVGFIGLGNVGSKLAGSLLRNDIPLIVRDLDQALAQPFLDGGAQWANSPAEMAEAADVIITCLPSPKACAEVMEAERRGDCRPKTRQNMDRNEHHRLP